jgi:hypothetical protein
VAVVLFSGAGCGEQGVAEDATVAVYVSAPLCAEAERGMGRGGETMAEVELRTVCVDDVGGPGESRLAAIGAAARQAIEDSSSIAYIGTRDPVAVRFSEPILEEAGIPRISAASGSAGVTRLLRALSRIDDPDSLRESLVDELP